MNAFRSLPAEKVRHLTEPYMLSCAAMLSFTAGMLDEIGVRTQARFIFSQQVEFRNCASQFYEYAVSRDSTVGKLIAPPQFGEMRDVVPLQAADIIAYELYKECDRRFNAPSRQPRHGFQVIKKMSSRVATRPGYVFIGKSDLLAFISASEAMDRKQSYWKNRRMNDLNQS